MTAVSTQDLAALRLSVADFLAARSPESQVRVVMETDLGYDLSVWSQMALQLGLQGLIIPEKFGGSGYGFEELAVVFVELGRVLYPGPLLATSLATFALVHGEAVAVSKAYLPGIATGEMVASFALDQPAGGAVGTPSVIAIGGVLSGSVSFVLDGHLDGLLVVEALDGDERALFAVDPGAVGLTRTRVATTDRTRRLAEVSLDQTPGTRLGGAELASRLRSVAAVALACSQIGGAESALHSAVAYSLVRVQFGKPIGSFQSIKHVCAEGFSVVESGKAAARRAARAVASNDPELEVVSSIAKAWCSDAYSQTASANVQVHGGIGFTWEASAQLHLKRAKTDELLLGDSRHHRARLADVLGI